MKKLLLAGAASLVLAVPAMAADLGQPPVIAPVYNWTGFYFGGNGGYGLGNSSTNYTAIGLTPFSTSQSMNSWVAGGQLGFNWQFNENWVFGAEADIQGTGQNSTATLPSLGIAGSFEQRLPFFFTARLRLGFLPVDSWMLYVTGGAAYGEVETNATVTTTAATSMSSSTNIGWTVGGGTELLISGAWTAKLEYLYVDLGTVSTPGTGTFPTLNTGSHVTESIVRVGVNYQFGTPVVPKY